MYHHLLPVYSSYDTHIYVASRGPHDISQFRTNIFELKYKQHYIFLFMIKRSLYLRSKWIPTACVPCCVYFTKDIYPRVRTRTRGLCIRVRTQGNIRGGDSYPLHATLWPAFLLFLPPRPPRSVHSKARDIVNIATHNVSTPHITPSISYRPEASIFCTITTTASPSSNTESTSKQQQRQQHQQQASEYITIAAAVVVAQPADWRLLST